MRQKDKERAEAIARLRDWLRPGDTVHTILEHVARSGMSRTVRMLLIKAEEGKVLTLHPNHAFAQAIGARLSSVRGRDGVALPWTADGFDAGFHIVYTASRYMWPNGFGCIGPGCPSNDHPNGDRDYTIRAAHWHKDGGYALRQVWLL